MTDTLDLSADQLELPFSILDTDLYKLSMQNAVIQHFYDSQVVIRFTNRAPHMHFNRQSFEWIQERVNRLDSVTLSPKKRTALENACPYFPSSYIDYLQSMRLDPINQVALRFVPAGEGSEDKGEIECVIKGPWRDVILYEVPIMSIISEGYFKFVDTDWTYDGQIEQAKRKALALLSPGDNIGALAFSEFGTRRRRSFKAHDMVIRGLIQGQEEWRAGGGQGVGLAGTSNVYLALKYGIPPSGTIAHEWIMGIGAKYGYAGSNGRAMDMWEAAYPRGENAAPLTMLTDTFTASAFFTDFKSNLPRALRWTTLRQDSGDPLVFVKQARDVWEEIEAEAGLTVEQKRERVKRVVFSDGLDIERAVGLQKGCNELGIGAAFGIGTFFTNDFRKSSSPGEVSKPLNIVIKLSEIDGRPCVKLSDDRGKYTGNVDEVKRVQRELGLTGER